jgi:hypothetical protein
MMNYPILQITVEPVPWRKWYSRKCVEDWAMRKDSVEDDYDAQENFGFYEGDDKLAYSHACKVLESLSKKPELLKPESYMAALYQTLLKDIRRFIMASECLGKEKYNVVFVENLLRKAAEVSVGENLVGFVMKHFREYRDSNKQNKFGETGIALDFPELYMECGDKALYEMQDKKLAMKFYRLKELNWHGGKEKESSSNDWLNTLGRILDGKYRFLAWKCGGREYQQCRDSYCAYMKEYAAGRGDKAEYLELANEFADYFRRIIEGRRLSRKPGDEEQTRDLVRMCYAMALVVRETVFISACARLAEEPREVQNQYDQDVLGGLKRMQMDELKPIRRYWSRKTIRTHEDRERRYRNTLMMIKVLSLADDVKHILLVRDHKDEIAYYTSLNTLRFMLPERGLESAGCLSIMHMSYMNDPNEGKILRQFFDENSMSGGRNHRRSLGTPYVFMKCFTSLIDNLPMWEMYGDHAEGCCIVLDSPWYTKADEKQVVPLYHICYLAKTDSGYCLRKEDNPQVADVEQLEELLEELKKVYSDLRKSNIPLEVFEELVSPIVYLFKDANYKQEQESRILYYFSEYAEAMKHTPGEYPKLYLQTDFTIRIREIILGPKVGQISEMLPYLQEQLEKLCKKTGDDMPDITLSEIDYR